MEFKLKKKPSQNYFLLASIGGTVVPNLPKGKLGNNCFCQSQKLLTFALNVTIYQIWNV